MCKKVSVKKQKQSEKPASVPAQLVMSKITTWKLYKNLNYFFKLHNLTSI